MCACDKMSDMVLVHINVKILSAVRSWPLIQVSFRVPYFSITFRHEIQ